MADITSLCSLQAAAIAQLLQPLTNILSRQITTLRNICKKKEHPFSEARVKIRLEVGKVTSGCLAVKLWLSGRQYGQS